MKNLIKTSCRNLDMACKLIGIFEKKLEIHIIGKHRDPLINKLYIYESILYIGQMSKITLKINFWWNFLSGFWKGRFVLFSENNVYKSLIGQYSICSTNHRPGFHNKNKPWNSPSCMNLWPRSLFLDLFSYFHKIRKDNDEEIREIWEIVYAAFLMCPKFCLKLHFLFVSITS